MRFYRSILAVASCCAAILPGPVASQDASALQARHAALREQLAGNGFGRPVHVESSASEEEHHGEVYALVEHPFAVVAPALARPDHWCQILMLQVNVKRCEAPGHGAGPTVTAFITRKARDTLEDAHRVQFDYALAAAGGDYVRVSLASPSGPFGTSDYRLVLQAAPADAARTFLHLSYAYKLGLVARIGLDAYLATSGRDKVGFSVVGRLPDGRPVYVDGVRGIVERSAMRYYFAIEAFLDSLDAPAGQRLKVRLRDWYAAIERHPLQLRESVGREEYFAMKQN